MESSSSKSQHHLFSKVKIIANHLPQPDLLDGQAGISVRQRQEKVPSSQGKGKKNASSDPEPDHALASESLTGSYVPLRPSVGSASSRALFLSRLSVEDEFEKSTRYKARGNVRGEIVVQEELTPHQEEWEIVSGPCQEEEPS